MAAEAGRSTPGSGGSRRTAKRLRASGGGSTAGTWEMAVEMAQTKAVTPPWKVSAAAHTRERELEGGIREHSGRVSGIANPGLWIP